MKKVQFIIFVLALVVSTVYFLFTLSFSTGWALGETFLHDFFVEAQIANKEMFKWAVRTVVASGVLLLLNTHKNKKLFVMNFIAIAFAVFFLVYPAIITLGYMGSLKEVYTELPEAFLTIIVAINYSNISTDIFDIGVIISYLMILEAVLIVVITGFKIFEQFSRSKARKQFDLGVHE